MQPTKKQVGRPQKLPSTTKTVTLRVDLDPILHSGFAALAARERRTQSDLVREILRRAVEDGALGPTTADEIARLRQRIDSGVIPVVRAEADEVKARLVQIEEGLLTMAGFVSDESPIAHALLYLLMAELGHGKVPGVTGPVARGLRREKAIPTLWAAVAGRVAPTETQP